MDTLLTEYAHALRAGRERSFESLHPRFVRSEAALGIRLMMEYWREFKRYWPGFDVGRFFEVPGGPGESG